MQKKVKLRDYTIEDAYDRYKWSIDPDTVKYLPMPDQLLNLEDIKNWIELNTLDIINTYKHKAIITDEGHHIGWIDLNHINHEEKNAEIGIVIGEKQYRKKGYGYHSLIEGLNWAFNILKLNTIWLRVDEDHSSAIHLYQKIGFKFDNEYNESRTRNGIEINRIKMSLNINNYFSVNKIR